MKKTILCVMALVIGTVLMVERQPRGGGGTRRPAPPHATIASIDALQLQQFARHPNGGGGTRRPVPPHVL